MAVEISIATYERLSEKLGKEGAEGITDALRRSLEEVENKTETTLNGVRDRAEHLIAQKKFEIKNELITELATKEDVAIIRGEIKELRGEFKSEINRLEGEFKSEINRLEGEIKSEINRLEGEIKELRGEFKGEIKALRQEIKAMFVTQDRKYTIMFLILIFTILFTNQGALVFIAKLLGLVK